MKVREIDGFIPQYRKTNRNNDVKGMEAYLQKNNERIGTVTDILEDTNNHSCYLVLNLDAQTSSKKVLLPVTQSQIDHEADFVYVIGLSREQIRYLPEFKENLLLDCNDEDI
ncbi:MAG: PRC-barrel domain-containing protein [Chroococcidiopsidaceae cyanobacterium CP_BM_ER_R8_30]|nr:PRC-barrel domain-containing protein [Chroococcidiopsidaceae cyanobacterium CP_BM_ER_R8_30]